jgi:hypothetical protein
MEQAIEVDQDSRVAAFSTNGSKRPSSSAPSASLGVIKDSTSGRKAKRQRKMAKRQKKAARAAETSTSKCNIPCTERLVHLSVDLYCSKILAITYIELARSYGWPTRLQDLTLKMAYILS